MLLDCAQSWIKRDVKIYFVSLRGITSSTFPPILGKYIHVCIVVCMYMYACECKHVCVYACMYFYVYMRVCICVYLYVYVHKCV